MATSAEADPLVLVIWVRFDVVESSLEAVKVD
jgi:hypothetical protein